MTLPFLIAFGVVIGGWSFLSVLGNERQRLVQDRELAAKRAAAAAAAAAASEAEAPVGR
jgi:hypothetical protein